MPTLVGTAAADELRGDIGDDSISGLDGPDTLNGLAGADTLDGGAGNDSLIDWTGNDVLLGGAGDDVITADHRFSDSATTQSATLNGGDGDDVIFAYARYGLFFTPPANLETFSASLLGGAGNDHIEARGDFASTIDAGAGDDTVIVGQTIAQPTLLTLGPGADAVKYEPRLIWTTSVLTITDFQPGDGGDHLISPFASTDLLSNWDHSANPFNDGHLRLIQRGADTVLQIDRDAAGTSFTFQDMVVFRNTQSSAFTAFNTFDFSPSGEATPGQTLVGTPAFDSLTGGTGDDSIEGLGGSDAIYGGAGDDSIDGGEGDDQLNGGPGNDSLIGGSGDDIFFVGLGEGSDTISGGAGNDAVDANQSHAPQVLRGDDGNDGIGSGSGDDSLAGGAGDDTIGGGLGDDTIDGGSGDDQITGGGGHDLIVSGTGVDTIIFNGSTNLAAQSGLNVVTDWSSADRLQIYSDANVQAGGVFVTHTAADYASAHATADSDIRAGTASFVAVQIGADVVLFAATPGSRVGAQEAIVLQGRTLADITAVNIPGVATGSGGGSSGSPSAGDDSLTASPSSSEIHAGSGNDTIVGASVPDYLRGDDGNDSIAGGSAFDDLNGNMGNDTAHGNAGDDWVVGGKDNDMLFGDAGGDVVWGNLGNDTLDGGDGADQVRGGQGDDVVNGGAGNDFVSGDRGNDTITGGTGADNFHDSQDASLDRVLDFSVAEGDRVMLDPGTTYSVSQVGADTVIDFGAGNQMILVGVQMSTLPTGWIFFG